MDGGFKTPETIPVLRKEAINNHAKKTSRGG